MHVISGLLTYYCPVLLFYTPSRLYLFKNLFTKVTLEKIYRKWQMALTHYCLQFPFYTPWKH